MKFLFFFVFCVLFSNNYGAKILGIVPTPSYSHQVVFFPLWRELSLRGHQVTLCTTDPIKDPDLTNLTQIDWSYSYHLWNVKYNFTKIIQEAQKSMFFDFSKMMDLMAEILETELAHPEVQKLIKDKDQEFDVVLLEYWFPTMAAFSFRFNCPIIGIFSLDAQNHIHELIGNPTHPVLYPDFILPFEGKLSFFERIRCVFLTSLNTFLWKNLYKMDDDKYIKKYFGDNYPTGEKIFRNISMMFLNVNPVFHTVRPVTPATIVIGGGMQLQKSKSKSKPLPQDIKSFLDNSTEGVVYFSLGSNAKSKEIPDETKKVIMDTFAELPYKVLWKFEDEDLPGKPANVKISKWLPQQDVLRHPNIKLFITQGGLQSIEEAIYSHVPMIGMAYFGDQPMNVKKLVSRGMGLQVDKDNIEKGAFKETILEVINNPRYRNKVKELAELALDQPMTGLEKAVWWTEYVIRHKGAPHLKSPAVDMPLYQYFLLDVIGFLLAVLLISIWAAYKMIRLILRLFLKSSNIDTNKKKN